MIPNGLNKNDLIIQWSDRFLPIVEIRENELR
jgi:hypothetical protein